MMPEKRFNVTVLGAAGGIGQPLSLLLKNSPYVKELRLSDVIKLVEGVAEDISHIETDCKVSAFAGSFTSKEDQHAAVAASLQGCDIVIIPAGVPRKPGMSRDDLFNINAGIVKGLVEESCDACPDAMLLIISNPVNSIIPIAGEIMKKKGIPNWQNKLMGISTLDIVRANTFVGEELGKDPAEIDVPVVGGHSGGTILPLFSQLKPEDYAALKDIPKLTKKVQDAGQVVVEAKQGAGSATLSMAYAAARFAVSVMKGINGEDVTECSFIATQLIPGVEYFALPIKLGENGIAEVLPLPEGMSDFEKQAMEQEVIPELAKSIEKGIEFANK